MNTPGIASHLLVATAAASTGVLAAFGFVGEPQRKELFDAKTIVVQPIGDDGLRITEYVDADSGDVDRHGYFRKIPHDFGAPIDVEASSPDAPDEVSTSEGGIGDDRYTEIRVGDPDTTINDQHRYVLSYTLPAAKLASGRLFLDIIGEEEVLRTSQFSVVLTGFEFDTAECQLIRLRVVAAACPIVREGATYRAELGELAPRTGVTILGTGMRRIPVTDIDEPPIVPRRTTNRAPLAAATAGLGALAGLLTFAGLRRRGRNEVYAGGAADAADSRPGDGRPTKLMTDAAFEKLATTEFVPPTGITTWQGVALQTEHTGSSVMQAWFADQIVKEVVSLAPDDTGKHPVMSLGPHPERMEQWEHDCVSTMLGDRASLELGSYDEHFAKGWAAAEKELKGQLGASGWWRHGGPGQIAARPKWALSMLVLVGIVGLVVLIVAVVLRRLSSPIGVVLLGAGVTAAVGWFAYAGMEASRTAVGSAHTLRVESFGRFLRASEGRHVEWAWTHGLLREYSAWAVALGAADAWKGAAAASSVPPNDPGLYPIWVSSMSPSITSARVEPTSSSGSGSGGDSGGFSGGGGGGGGSSGLW